MADTTATDNAIATLEKSLKAAQPGSKEQTQISIALYDLKKKRAEQQNVKEEATTKTKTEEKKNNVVAGSSAGETSPTARQFNPLSMYSSSTYKISLYMITPEASNNYLNTGKWDLKKMILVVQSGGRTKGVDPERTEHLGLDLYIDNLDITTVIGSKETGNASTSYDFKFQIYEPYGFSFVSRLVQTALDMQSMANIKQKVDQPLNALQVDYLLAVHFYGYDSEGQVYSGPADASGHSSGVASGAAFERMFPISLVKMTSRLDNKTTVYDIGATLTGSVVGFSKSRAPKESVSLSAATVKGALDLYAAIYNKKQVLISGQDEKLMQSLPDSIEFVFDDSASISNALIVDSNHFLPGNTGMPDVLKPIGINVRLSDSGKADLVKKERAVQIPAGSTVLQVVDQIITQSSFLTDVLKTVDKEIIDKVQETDKGYSQNANPKELFWYHVTPQVIWKDWDEKRKMKACTIRYIIQRKEVPYVRSVAVEKTSTYKGPFKKYDYWYTGKNSEVISYEQTFNLLYYVTGAASSEVANNTSKEVGKVVPSTVTDAPGVGSLPNAKEQTNSIRTALYSPGDNIHANIKILGDPDYLMTSESGTVDTVKQKWYGDDYSINPANSQVFIELAFKQVEDYDTELGYMKPNNNIYFWDYPEDIKKMTDGMIYMVISVKSKFSKGQFIQELKTVLPPFLETASSTTSTDSSRPAAGGKKLSQQELAALQRAPGSGSGYKQIPNKPAPTTFNSLVSDQAGNDLIVKKSTSPIVNNYGRK